MLFHPYQKDITHVTPRLMLNNDEIERVDSFNFLGVTIDKHLNWKQHIEIITNKLSKYCGILSKLKNYLPTYIMRTLYFSMVQSHLNFGSLLWGYDCNRLIKLQKRIIRTISRSKYNAHTNPLFKELFILKLPDIVSLNALKIYYKYQKNALPVYFTTFDIQPQSSIHDHHTRQSNDIRTHRTRIKLTEKCLRNYLPTIINLTPAYILSRVNTHSIQGFSSAIKSHLLNAYEAECAIQNCYVCQRQR